MLKSQYNVSCDCQCLLTILVDHTVLTGYTSLGDVCDNITGFLLLSVLAGRSSPESKQKLDN